MPIPRPRLIAPMLAALLLVALSTFGAMADVTRFVGTYSGSAVVEQADGTALPRDMSVTIARKGDGFRVEWSSITHRDDGRVREKSYSIDFVPSERGSVYAAAMKRNVFGHTVQMDPMKGEPYVWSRISGDTLTVYSLFVAEDGGYEMQQFDRTLTDGGLQLNFKRISDGTPRRSVQTFLKKD